MHHFDHKYNIIKCHYDIVKFKIDHFIIYTKFISLHITKMSNINYFQKLTFALASVQNVHIKRLFICNKHSCIKKVDTIVLNHQSSILTL